MTLYHKNVYWPKRIRRNLPFGVRPLSYSNHAIRACSDDRYGRIVRPSKINMDDVEIFEAEWNGGVVTKIVFRLPHCSTHDIVMACIVKRGGLFVKTVWLNERADDHKTLDSSKYVGV